VRGQGVRLQDDAGSWFIDALSGLYNVNVGYGRRELGIVAADEMSRLGFGTLFFGRATPPTIALAEKLTVLTPASIAHIFFTVGGSDAVDSAIKLIRHANALAGHAEKVKVIARIDSYHGMTLAATTATGQAALRRDIGPLMPAVVHVSQPDPTDGRVSAVELEQAILRERPETVAAFIGEPVAVPPGVRIPAPDYWPEIQSVCRKYEVRLVVDEVITGFGRTGTMFASEHWGLEPDVIAMSKGLSSGYVPIGALGISAELMETLQHNPSILPHGFTTGGHPTCCAVALANIGILEREGLVANAASTGQYLAACLAQARQDHMTVDSARSIGMLGALDVLGEVDERPASLWVVDQLEAHGVLTRSYGNTIVVAPCLISTRSDIDDIFTAVTAVLSELQNKVSLEPSAI
jgi:adenosylmethionine-8-amino-7-oxononanoate aminotransferase